MDNQTMKPLPRIRTIPECVDLILEADENTALSRRYIRDVCKKLPGTIRRGRLFWVDYDELLEYLSDPHREERERVQDYEEARSRIRPVPEGRR